MSKIYQFTGSVALGAALLLAACEDPGKGKTAAQVGEAVTPAAATSDRAATKYEFSEAQSKLTFVGAKVTKKHDGSFQKF